MIQIDMDMPKCCADCDMETYEENYNGDPTFHYCPMVYKGYTNEIRDRGRLNDCPLKEVRNGKWDIEISDDGYQATYRCSECGHQFKWIHDPHFPPVFNYCQKCGAGMRKES